MGRLDAFTRRVRALRPSAVDGMLAVVLLVIIVLVDTSGARQPIPGVMAGMLPACAVAVRRQWPVFAAGVAFLGVGLVQLLDGMDNAVAPVAVALTYYTLGRRSAERGWNWADGAILLLPVVGIATDPNTASPGGTPLIVDIVSVWGFFLLIPFAAGRAVGTRTLLIARLESNTQRLVEEQRERAHLAAAEERIRIARELHDVVAHSMSVIVMQTAAARRIVDRDRGAVREAMVVVEACGRDAILELRRMVGVLRRDDIDVLGAAIPGLGQLDKLAERARRSGLAVRVSVEGDVRALPPALDLVSYRVVQEALTNAIKHAGPAMALVRVTFAGSSVELQILDTGQGSPPVGVAPHIDGQGLVGMRERVALYGGTLRAGPVRGGFEVRACLPLGEPGRT